MSSKPFKIAIIGSRGYPHVYSGYETLVKEIGERLVKQQVEVVVYCHKHLFETRPKSWCGIKLVYIPTIRSKVLSQPIHSFMAFWHAGFSNADVILALNAANGPFGLIAKICGKPAAINVDGLEWLRPKWKGLGAVYFRFAAWVATKLFNTIITDAEAMRQIYLKQFGKDSMVIAYGGHVKQSRMPAVIREWHLNIEDYYLIVGRMIPDNNADIIIEGFVQSKSTKKLVVVGDVPYKDAYADKIKSETDPRVIFTGYVTDANMLAELYHQSYAYFHGHEFGGTNPTLLKAMAYGSAVAALDTVFSREVLQNDLYGYYFEKNPGAVTAFIDWAEANPEAIKTRKSIIRSGIGTKYHWDTITSLYLSTLKKLISKTG
jgi:glycosyltransferase involved in cell wall biosynthesis